MSTNLNTTPQEKQPQPPSTPFNLSMARQAYVQRNYEAYELYFNRVDQHRGKFVASWSWWGFIAPLGWLFYRKMYLIILGYLIVGSIFCEMLNFNFILQPLMNIATSICGLDAGIDLATFDTTFITLTQDEMKALEPVFLLLQFLYVLLCYSLTGIVVAVAGPWLYLNKVDRKVMKARQTVGDDFGKITESLNVQGKSHHPVRVAIEIYVLLPLLLLFVSLALGSMITGYMTRSGAM